MSKGIGVLSISLVVLIALSTTTYANEIVRDICPEDEVLIFIDDQQIVFPDQKPYIDQNFRTLVPLRSFIEALGGEIRWFPKTRDILIESEGHSLLLTVGSQEYELNNEKKSMDTKPETISGQTMVPLRFITQALQADVKYKFHEHIGLVFNFTDGQAELDDKKQLIIQAKDELTQTIESEGIRHLMASSKDPAEHFLFPIDTSVGYVSSEYGMRGSRFHHGIDYVVPSGTSIMAAEDGTVVYSGWRGTYGNLIIIDHGMGYQTYYAHNAANLVVKNQQVLRGDVIATIGRTGNATGDHLHFEVHYDGSTKNPMNYFEL